MSDVITIALSKGKLLEPTLELFRKAGYAGYHVQKDDRRLILDYPEHGHRVLIVRPSDVPAYVEYGAADLGVVGKDVLLEQSPDVYEPVDLNLGVCKLVVARPKGQQPVQRLSSKLRVATKYPTITERFFNQQGLPVELIKLYGSIELAPLVGLADRIVDLVETGNTLKANNLVEDEVIAWSSARLIVNRASLKMKHAVISELIARVKKKSSRISIQKGLCMKILSNKDREFSQMVESVCRRAAQQNTKVEKVVRTILNSVRRDGDQALQRLTWRFDRVRISPDRLRVTSQEVRDAYAGFPSFDVKALKYATNRIRTFHRRQIRRSWLSRKQGVQLGQRITPLDAVGVYVPGGKALYPSSVLMNAIPAKVAGVARVVMCTPTPTGTIHPALLVAADLAGVDEIYRVGGAQAIGALAFGTATIGAVDKIVGPGNLYVATAKRLVYGQVDIDMIAGPSELLVIADSASNPSHVAADLLCEAEHDEEARVYLVTTSIVLAKRVVAELTRQLAQLGRQMIASRSIGSHALAFVVRNLDEAFELANRIAPEHLSLNVNRAGDFVPRIRHAGAIFVGRYTPPAVADYVAGPNHVLPTGGSARFFSCLGVDEYIKTSNVVAYSQAALRKARVPVMRLSQLEGLDAHGRSMESRWT